MSFASPFWLVFLIPWLWLVLWLLIGQRDRVAVPFLELWSGPMGSAKVRRTIQPPPIALVCALAAVLLGVVGAAAPMVHRHRMASGMTLIVDRGVTMAAMSRGESRLVEARRSMPAIAPDRVVLVPPWRGLLQDGSNWKDAPPSAVKTADLLSSAVADARNASDNTIVVLSDQNIGFNDPRITRISPASVPENLDIVQVAASASNPTQVMVRVRNQSAMKTAELQIASAGQTTTNSIDLPPREQEKNVFIDLPKVGDVIQVKLSPADDLAADSVAWMVRRRNWPRIEVRAAVSAEVRRMIEVYQAHRAAGEDSRIVGIVDRESALAGNDSGVIVSVDRKDAKPQSDKQRVHVADHPVALGVDWDGVAKAVTVGAGPGEGWTAAASVGDRVLVAVREAPARRVWVGFESPSFATRPDFVIFWTNVLDWVGQGGEEFVSEPVSAIGDEWKLQTPALDRFDISPGVYRRSDGMLRALDAMDVRFASASGIASQSNSSALISAGHGDTNLSPAILLAAMFMLLASALFWKSEMRFSAA